MIREQKIIDKVLILVNPFPSNKTNHVMNPKNSQYLANKLISPAPSLNLNKKIQSKNLGALHLPR